MKKENVCFSFIPRMIGKQDELEYAPEIEYLLEKFQDIIFDNVPYGLPPLRRISQCMD